MVLLLGPAGPTGAVLGRGREDTAECGAGFLFMVYGALSKVLVVISEVSTLRRLGLSASSSSPRSAGRPVILALPVTQSFALALLH